LFLSGLETVPSIDYYVCQVSDTDFSYILARNLTKAFPTRWHFPSMIAIAYMIFHKCYAVIGWSENCQT